MGGAVLARAMVARPSLILRLATLWWPWQAHRGHAAPGRQQGSRKAMGPRALVHLALQRAASARVGDEDGFPGHPLRKQTCQHC